MLDELIKQLLIVQSAEAEGVTISDQALQGELGRLIDATGGEEDFREWLEKNQYSNSVATQPMMLSSIPPWSHGFMLRLSALVSATGFAI